MLAALKLLSAAELDDAAAVALGGTALGQGRELLHGLAFGGCFGARSNAGFTFAIEGLRHRRRTAHLAQSENFYLKISALVLHFKMVTDMNLAGGLGFVAIGEDAAQVTGLGGQSTRFEEARCPEPFVDAQGVHGVIVIHWPTVTLR